MIRFVRNSVSFLLGVLVTLIVILLTGCVESKPVRPKSIYKYGDVVAVGQGFYAGQKVKIVEIKGYYSDCRVSYWVLLSSQEKVYVCEDELGVRYESH